MNREGQAMAGSKRLDVTLTGEDFDRAVMLIEELHEAGRLDDATAVYRLIVAAERAGLRPPAPAEDDDLTDEDLAALRQSEEDLAAGRIISSDVVKQGPAAVAEYIRRRDAGDVDPETAAGCLAFRLYSFVRPSLLVDRQQQVEAVQQEVT